MDDTELVQFEVTAERPRRKRGKLKLLLSLIPAVLAVAAAVRRYRSSNAELERRVLERRVLELTSRTPPIANCSRTRVRMSIRS